MGAVDHVRMVLGNLWRASAGRGPVGRPLHFGKLFIREVAIKLGLARPVAAVGRGARNATRAAVAPLRKLPPLAPVARGGQRVASLARVGARTPRRAASAARRGGISLARRTYHFVERNFFTAMYPVNFVLSLLLRRRKYDNSVLHISYMVHIPWYTTRIQRKHGMKADYLSVGGESPWWKKFDLHFPRRWPPLFFQEWFFFWKVMAKYEVIHSHFGIQMSQTGWEIPHLKRLGRKIVVHYRGCEVRDPEANQLRHPDCNICSLCDYNGTVCREGKPRVQKANAFGDAFLVTTPDMQDFEPDAIHFPFFTPEIDYRAYAVAAEPYDGRRPLRIVHATNHPGIEGTARIQQAVARLNERGYAIEFTFLRGKTPDEVLRAMAAADLTIGKMKMGYYANTQIESMFLGVPAITHVRPEFLTPEVENSGLILSSLDRLEATIAHYADHPEDLAHKRAIARSSILEVHDNDKLAARLRRIYREALGETVSDEQEAEWAQRPLRVLHIGNIANNAYYNGRLLRRDGVHADVLCYDNYWVMSSPEWEEARFEGVPSDQGLPNWREVGLGRYRHPRWFAQGERSLAIEYLIEQQSQGKRARRAWRRLTKQRRLLSRPLARKIDRILGLPGKALRRVGRAFESLGDRLLNYETGAEAHAYPQFVERCEELVKTFAARFPEREDALEVSDLTPYFDALPRFAELFSYYDVIQGYATDPVYPMLAGFAPYVAFEHGTLRDAPEWNWEFKGPFFANPIGRITALSYALADHSFITNADCKRSAERLGLASYSGMPHPSADDAVFRFDPEARAEILAELGVGRIFLCPIRHDWAEKGTDRYIRAIPGIRERIGEDFVVCFTPWGREIERSKALIEELGVGQHVRWVGPFGAIELVRWLSASDAVFDQLTYESFSGMTPRALACGTPILACYNPDVAAWMFPEPAPVLVATTPDAIVETVANLCEPGALSDYRERARAWIERWHSSEGIVRELMRVYQRALNPAPPVLAPTLDAATTKPSSSSATG